MTKRVLVTCMVLVERMVEAAAVDSVAEPVRAPAVSPVGDEAVPLEAGADSLPGAGTLGAAEEELGSPGAVVMELEDSPGLTVTVSVPVICSDCQLHARVWYVLWVILLSQCGEEPSLGQGCRSW